MKVIRTIDEIKKLTEQWREAGCSVGLVPTMGFLHDGHMSLVRESVRNNDKTVISIFVNPMQFGEREDLDEYPRDIDGDIKVSSENKVDAIFAPAVNEMYPAGFSSIVDVKGVSDGLAGESRPGHFQGVCTVVNKLFNIISPDNAYFGQKDAQQLAVIKKMVKDLDMNLKVIGCPTVRENDGLAMSSRNSYLDSNQRNKAVHIYKALSKGNEVFMAGETDPGVIKDVITNDLSKVSGLILDYLEIANGGTMIPCPYAKDGCLCLISVKIGDTALIDNIVLGQDIL